MSEKDQDFDVKGIAHSRFSELYLKYKEPIRKFIRMKISDQEVAEDLTQEVFMKAYRSREQYQERFAFSTWIWIVARNTIIDHLRGNARSVGIEYWVEEIADPAHSVETLLIQNDERREQFIRLKKLSRLQRKVLSLRLIHQLSYDEIAKKLGLSLSSVKNLIYRARLQFAVT